jgi:hypothetical protein
LRAGVDVGLGGSLHDAHAEAWPHGSNTAWLPIIMRTTAERCERVARHPFGKAQ